MKERHHKSRRGAAGLPPLPPESAAALKEQLARLKSALAAGEAPAALPGLVSPRPHDLAWDLHLISGLAHNCPPRHPSPPGGAVWRSPGQGPAEGPEKGPARPQDPGGAGPGRTFFRGATQGPQPAAGSVLQAQVSSIFGNGERYVILEGPREVMGGNLLVTRLNDQQGLRECHLLTLKRRQQQEFWEHFHSQGLNAWAAGTPGLCPAPVGGRPGPDPRRRGRPGRLPPPAGDPLAPPGPPPGRPGPGRPAPPLEPHGAERLPGEVPGPGHQRTLPFLAPQPRGHPPLDRTAQSRPGQPPGALGAAAAPAPGRGAGRRHRGALSPGNAEPCGAAAYSRRPAFSIWRAAPRRPGPPRPPGRTSSPGIGASSPAKTPFSRNWCATP